MWSNQAKSIEVTSILHGAPFYKLGLNLVELVFWTLHQGSNVSAFVMLSLVAIRKLILAQFMVVVFNNSRCPNPTWPGNCWSEVPYQWSIKVE
jgi:hypothetical protein